MPFQKGQSGNPKGKPKGIKHRKTIVKEMEEAEMRRVILQRLAPLIDAQIANAQGTKYLVVRERKGGKFVRVAEAMARTAKAGKLGENEEIIEVWEKDPSVHAFDSLLDRAFGKAKQPKQEVEHSGDLRISWEANE